MDWLVVMFSLLTSVTMGLLVFIFMRAIIDIKSALEGILAEFKEFNECGECEECQAKEDELGVPAQMIPTVGCAPEPGGEDGD